MGKAIVWAALGLLATTAWSWAFYKAGQVIQNNRIIRNGGSGLQGITLLKEARELFEELRDPALVIRADGVYDILTDQSIKKVNAWLQAFNKWREKGRVR